MVTNDTSWAEQDIFLTPRFIPEFEGCISEGNACQDQGGIPVWRCDKRKYRCETSLSTGGEGFEECSTAFLREDEVDGCACQLSLDPTSPCNFFTWIFQFLFGWFLGLFGISIRQL